MHEQWQVYREFGELDFGDGKCEVSVKQTGNFQCKSGSQERG